MNILYLSTNVSVGKVYLVPNITCLATAAFGARVPSNTYLTSPIG